MERMLCLRKNIKKQGFILLQVVLILFLFSLFSLQFMTMVSSAKKFETITTKSITETTDKNYLMTLFLSEESLPQIWNGYQLCVTEYNNGIKIFSAIKEEYSFLVTINPNNDIIQLTELYS